MRISAFYNILIDGVEGQKRSLANYAHILNILHLSVSC